VSQNISGHMWAAATVMCMREHGKSAYTQHGHVWVPTQLHLCWPLISVLTWHPGKYQQCNDDPIAAVLAARQTPGGVKRSAGTRKLLRKRKRKGCTHQPQCLERRTQLCEGRPVVRFTPPAPQHQAVCLIRAARQLGTYGLRLHATQHLQRVRPGCCEAVERVKGGGRHDHGMLCQGRQVIMTRDAMMCMQALPSTPFHCTSMCVGVHIHLEGARD
jgi:hypothetical protein